MIPTKAPAPSASIPGWIPVILVEMRVEGGSFLRSTRMLPEAPTYRARLDATIHAAETSTAGWTWIVTPYGIAWGYRRYLEFLGTYARVLLDMVSAAKGSDPGLARLDLTRLGLGPVEPEWAVLRPNDPYPGLNGRPPAPAGDVPRPAAVLGPIDDPSTFDNGEIPS